MSNSYNVGDRLRWKWGDNWGYGKVKERFTEKVTRKIKGTEVTRNASQNEPAYLLEQDDGDRVLKSHSEVQKVG